MHNKLEKEMKQWTTEGLKMEDIMETVQVSQKIVDELTTKKYNNNIIQQLFSISSYHMPKTMIIQVFMCVLILAFGCTTLFSLATDSDSFQNIVLSMTMFFGVISMVATSSEMMRSWLMGSWEMEKACCMIPQKILIFKMSILASLSTILIFMGACIVSSLFQLSFLKIFFYGYVPFLVLTACILRFSIYLNSVETVLGAYAGGILIFYGLGVLTIENAFHTSFYVGILFGAGVLFIYSIYHYTNLLSRKIGGSV